MTAELRVSQAIESKLPPSARFSFEPSDKLRIYEEQERRWWGPVKIACKFGKEVTVTEGLKTQNYEIGQAIPLRLDPTIKT